MAAPASIPRTYSSARASMPCGLKGLRGYDIVESHVTVITSFSILSMGFSSNTAAYFPSKFLFLDDHYDSPERAAAHAIERVVNPIERKAGGHIGPHDAGGHHAHGFRHILPGTVAGTDDLELALGNFGGVDGRPAGLFSNHHDASAAHHQGGGQLHGIRSADTIEDALDA